MSILINGMKMPKNCMDCPLFESLYHFHGCHAKPESFNDRDMWNFFVGDRPSWCPLIEVPPHGRLIDADALDVICYCGIPQGRKDTFDNGVMWLAEQIDLLPTIIPAEECE